MFIIKKGNCMACFEEIGERRLNKLMFSHDNPEKLYEESVEDKKLKKKVQNKSKRGFNNLILDSDKQTRHSVKFKKIVFYTKNNNNLQIPFAELIEGSTFANRVILPTKFLFEEDKVLRHNDQPSQVTVVANSSEVELIIITQTLMSYFVKSKRVPSNNIMYNKIGTRL